MHMLTLRCKAIRGRILGVGAAWLGLDGVWLLGTQPKTYSIFARAHLLGQNKGPCDVWLCTRLMYNEVLNLKLPFLY